MENTGVRQWFEQLKEGLLGDIPAVTGAAMFRAAECAIRFVSAFLLANAQVFGSWRPFAIAAAAASGTGAEGFFALLGAAAGFILLGGLTGGVKHVSISFLISAVSFVLRGLRWAEKKLFQPVLAGVMTALIGFVFLLDGGISPGGVVMLLGEVGAVAGCTYLFSEAFSDAGSVPGKAGMFLMAAGLLAALAPIKLMGIISLGRMAACFAVLTAAHAGGWAVGAAIGAAAGAAIDLSAGGTVFFSLAFGLGGLGSGLLRSRKKYPGVLAFLIIMGICLLWQAQTAPVAALFETFGMCALFMLLPQELVPSGTVSKDSEGKTAARLAVRRLTDMAAVFAELFESMTAALSPENAGSTSLSSVFDRTAERVCKRCVMNHVCWQRDGEATRSALNDASLQFNRRGQAEASDFPTWFSSRCKNMPKFVSVLNEEIVALDYRRRYEKLAIQDRQLVANQYGELAKMLDKAAQRASNGPISEAKLSRRVEKYLKTLDMDTGSRVYRDGFGRLCIEIDSTGAGVMADLKEGLSAVVRTALSDPRQVAGGVIFTEKERLSPKVGLAVKCRREEEVCGDYGTWFRDSDGQLFLILSDGRGTGARAETESRSAVRVLERLLRAGAEPESAVRTLDSAYVLRGGGGGFATVDLMAVDLFSGRTTAIKWGAAPSYIRSSGHVTRMGEPSPPPGTGGDYEKTELILKEGDFIVMCSDGLADRDSDGWVRQIIEQYEGTSPRELAGRLAAVAEQTRGAGDDITVMAMTVESC